MMMRRVAVVVVGTLMTAVGCATLGIGQADQATRILADIRCITVATQAGLQIAGDPAVNGAKTALDVLSAISTLGSSNVPATVLDACKDTLGYAAEDAKGALALVTNSAGTDAAKISPPKTAVGPAREQPAKPTPVVIVLPKKAK